MNKLRRYGLLSAVLLGLLVTNARAALPAGFTTLLTDVDSTWTTVQGLAIGFIVFGIIVFVVKMVRKK